MKKVFLSDSGPEISTSIYSFWRWNKAEDLTIENVKETLSLVISLGINAIDISPVYGNGKVEELVGQAIKALGIQREDLVLFSKISHKKQLLDGSFMYQQLSPKHIQGQIENSLANLNTDYIDVVLVQDFDPLANLETVTSTLSQLLYKEKIRHIGISNFSVQQQQLFASRLSNEVVTNHFEFNLLKTDALNDGRIDFIKQQYSKPMAFGPLADGRILNGTDEKALKIRKALESLTSKYNSNVEQIAVAWILQLGALPIIGSLNHERITNAATADHIQLSYEDWHFLYQQTI